MRKMSSEKLVFLVSLLVTVLLLPSLTLSANILFLSPLASRSHTNFFDPIIDGLADKGHQVTAYSGQKRNNVHRNINHIYTDTWEKAMKIFSRDGSSGMNPIESKKGGVLWMMRVMFLDNMPEVQGQFLATREMEDLRKTFGKQRFDLVIVSSFFNEGVLPFAHYFDAPLVQMSPAGLLSWVGEAMGSPDIPSVNPVLFLPFGHRMTFLQRWMNSVAVLALKILTSYVYFPTVDNYVRQHFGSGAPTTEAMLRNISLIMLNSHFSLGYPKSLPPNVVEVAAVHCRPAKELPKSLKDFADNSGPEGFVYFSLGSVTNASSLPDDVRLEFLRAFSRLPYRVLWKWETGVMEDAPKNVRVEKWLPQQDVLGHPKIRLFITHGGLLSTEESIYHKVPIVGLPLFGDQDLNMGRAELAGIGKKLDIIGIKENDIFNTIQEVINGRRYRDNVRKMSELMRDRQNSPVDTAVWWLEYVIRHKGAKHMRPAALDLNLFQFYCFDVLFCSLAIVFLILYVPYRLVKMLLCVCCFKSAKKAQSKKAKKN